MLDACQIAVMVKSSQIMTRELIYGIVEDESEIYSREYRSGEREIRLIESLDRGVKVEAVILHPNHRDDEIVGRELVRIPDGRIFVFRPSLGTNEVRNAKLFANLWAKVDHLPLDLDPDVLPVEVAVIGKPAIAAYLGVVHGMFQRDIADQMGVNKKTVQQYWHRFI